MERRTHTNLKYVWDDKEVTVGCDGRLDFSALFRNLCPFLMVSPPDTESSLEKIPKDPLVLFIRCTVHVENLNGKGKPTYQENTGWKDKRFLRNF